MAIEYLAQFFDANLNDVLCDLDNSNYAKNFIIINYKCHSIVSSASIRPYPALKARKGRGIHTVVNSSTTISLIVNKVCFTIRSLMYA